MKHWEVYDGICEFRRERNANLGRPQRDFEETDDQIDDDFREAMWDVLRDQVSRLQNGLAESIEAGLVEKLKSFFGVEYYIYEGPEGTYGMAKLVVNGETSVEAAVKQARFGTSQEILLPQSGVNR